MPQLSANLNLTGVGYNESDEASLQPAVNLTDQNQYVEDTVNELAQGGPIEYNE
jgi:hypothetical protein